MTGLSYTVLRIQTILIRILLFTLIRIRILLFNLIRIRIRLCLIRIRIITILKR
jgi:hypothetical protein